MEYIKPVILDLEEKFLESVKVIQGDTARSILFSILSDGKPFDLTGKTVRVYAIKPDGEDVYNELEITNATEGLAKLKLTSQILAVPGKLKLILVISQGTDILSSNAIFFTIDPTIKDDNALESTSEYSAFITALSTAQSVETSFGDMLDRLDTIVDADLIQEVVAQYIQDNGVEITGGSVVSIVNEAIQNGEIEVGGEVSDAKISQAVSDYLIENPISGTDLTYNSKTFSAEINENLQITTKRKNGDNIKTDRVLIWEDDFDGKELDPNKWEALFGYYNANRYYMYKDVSRNAYCENSCLVLKNIKDYPNSDCNWSGAFVRTKNKFEFAYGRVEAKIKFPSSSEKYHSTFWTLGSNYDRVCDENTQGDETLGVLPPTAGEIDIAESDTGSVWGTWHYSSDEGNTSASVSTYNYGVTTNDWHIFAVEWTPTTLQFFVDDVLKGTVNIENATVNGYNPFKLPHFLMFNSNPAGLSTGSNTDDVTEITTYCDWVRVYAPVDVTAYTYETGIDFDNTDITLNQTCNKLITTTFSPDGASDKTLKWESYNESVAKCHGGKVTAVAPGNTFIRATSKHGYRKLCKVTVLEENFTVINNLSKSTTNNLATYVLKDGTYSATLTPNEGYSLSDLSVKVLYGGRDITSTAYSNGVIKISNVSDGIIITDSYSEPLNKTVGYQLTKNDSNGTIVDAGSRTLTNFIPVTPEVATLISVEKPSTASTNFKYVVRCYKSDYSYRSNGISSQGTSGVTQSDTKTFVSDVAYIRLVLLFTIAEGSVTMTENMVNGSKITVGSTEYTLDNTIVTIENGSSSGGGESETTTYTITNNLTNCSNSNVATSIAENTTYSATLTPNSGYKLSTVTVTMEGSDVTSTAYSNGTISINNVTGNIVITAVATVSSSGEIVEDEGTLGNPINGSTLNVYMDTSDTSGMIQESSGRATTAGMIPVTPGSSVNISVSDTNITYILRCYNSNKEYLSSGITSQSSSNGTNSDTKVFGDSTNYIRIIFLNATSIVGKQVTIGENTYTVASTDFPTKTTLSYTLSKTLNSSGELEDSTTRSVTDYIPVTPGSTALVGVYKPSTSSTTLCFAIRCYKSDKTYRGSGTDSSLGTVQYKTFISDVAYIRLIVLTNKDETTITDDLVSGGTIVIGDTYYTLSNE